ncbi:MAG: DUF4838 domain-containing protein [Chloroflexi bacterium]|nr:DUF4838 domain-containing protein [Chloroflexota bacterium]
MASSRLTLVNNGISRFTIVCPADAPAPIRRGANELQQYLAEMSGAILPISSDKSANGYMIVLERSDKLAEEEFTLLTTGKRLVISGGGKRGTLYGCYYLLDEILGVRWFTSRITRVPQKRTVSVGPLNIHEKPDFEYREPFYTEAFEKNWAVRNRVNGDHHHLDESVGGQISYGKFFVHNFNDLVPPEEYFDEHPEYFSLIDGKRMKGMYQICLTNPDVLRIALGNLRRWIAENPNATIFTVSQNDVYFNCQCDNCRAVEEEEGAASGVVLRFVNAIAEEIGKEYPHLLIDTLAYQWTEKPPKHVKPLPNVRIRLAPIYACFGHPLDGCKANEAAFANLKAWNAITDQLYVWHYSTNFAHYLQPFPNLDEVIADIPLFKKYGTVGLFYEGGYGPGGMCAQSELESYLMAKMMWHTDRDAKPIIDEFIDGVYGKAAPYIHQWLDLIHEPVRKHEWHVRIWDSPRSPYLSDEILAQGTKLFDKAERAVARNLLTLEMVQRARLGLDYVLLMRSLPRHEVKDGLYQCTQAVDYKLYNTLKTKVEQYGVGEIRESEPRWRFFQRITTRTKYPVLTLESDAVRADIVPELGGRIVSLVNKAQGLNVLRQVMAGDRGYPNGAGFYESFGIQDRGMGSREVYTGSATGDNATVELTTRDGIQVKRKYALKGVVLTITTEYANTKSAASIAPRSALELTWPDGPDPVVSYKTSDGKPGKLGIPEVGTTHTLTPEDFGEAQWQATLGKTKLTQSWKNQALASASVHGSRADRGINLVLTFEPQTLAAEETVAFTQEIKLS